MAEGRVRPELRLHVQVAHHRQQQRGQDIVPVSVRRRQFHVGLRVHGRHRFQSKNRVQARQTGQTSDMGHGGPGTLQDHYNGVLQGCHGIHSHVRHNQRGVIQQRAGLGNTDQDVLLGQRAGDTGGQQVRHGTRTCDIVRAGQNAGRRAEHRILRDVRQRQPQCQGRVRTTRRHHLRQDVRELGLGPDTGGRGQGHQAHRTAAGSEQSELQLLRVLYPVSDTHHGPARYFKQQNPLQQYTETHKKTFNRIKHLQKQKQKQKKKPQHFQTNYTLKPITLDSGSFIYIYYIIYCRLKSDEYLTHNTHNIIYTYTCIVYKTML